MRGLKVLIILLSFLSPSIATARTVAVNYSGDDGGYLVYSVGVVSLPMNFVFPYNRTRLEDGSPADDWAGKIEPLLGGMWSLKIKDPDFSGREIGHVVVRRLPPGQYRIQNFSFRGQLPGVASYDWSSGKPFEIRFTIARGAATYIGRFLRAPSLGTSLESQLGAAGYFILSNRAAQDMAMATARGTHFTSLDVQVADVGAFGNAALRSNEVR